MRRYKQLGWGIVAGALALVQSTDVTAQQTALATVCAAPMYRMVPTPDTVAQAWNQGKRWRLVIGTSEFSQTPAMNRPFIATTAKAIDERLAFLGYSPLPSRSAPSVTPYLSGTEATKEAITDALLEMARVAKPQDMALVYYVGHGTVSPGGTDLSLSVANRPVADDEGIRLSDMVGRLTVGTYHRDVKEIPRVVIVLETCYSGTIADNGSPRLTIVGDAQRLAAVPTPLIPNQISVLSATAGSDLSRAYELRGTGFSAFGYYFLRALKEEWACADTTADGVLTARELLGYLDDRLAARG